MTNKNDVRKLTNKTISEHQGDTLAAYAAVCNKTLGPKPDEMLLAVKQVLARRLAEEVMEEHGWERSDTGQWYHVNDAEFWARLGAAVEQRRRIDHEGETGVTTSRRHG